MVFLTNNLEWSATSIVALYRCRWQIEVFFKQIKQTLQLADFLGTSANAVRWQVWTALLVYLLLRYLAFLSEWNHSFTHHERAKNTSLWVPGIAWIEKTQIDESRCGQCHDQKEKGQPKIRFRQAEKFVKGTTGHSDKNPEKEINAGQRGEVWSVTSPAASFRRKPTVLFQS